MEIWEIDFCPSYEMPLNKTPCVYHPTVQSHIYIYITITPSWNGIVCYFLGVFSILDKFFVGEFQFIQGHSSISIQIISEQIWLYHNCNTIEKLLMIKR